MLTMSMIASVAYAMEEKRVDLNAKIAAFRAKNTQKHVIINGVLYMDPSSPAALAARAEYEERRLAQQRLALIRQEEEAAHLLQQEEIAARALQPRFASIDDMDNRSQCSSRVSNKENPANFYR